MKHSLNYQMMELHKGGKYLIVSVSHYDDDTYELNISIRTEWNNSEKLLSSSPISNPRQLSDLLYGVARVKVIETLEPL